MEEMWVSVRALQGRTLLTARGNPFCVVSVKTGYVAVVLQSTGKERRISRAEIEGAIALALQGRDISPSRLREAGVSEANPAYVAAIVRHILRQDTT